VKVGVLISGRGSNLRSLIAATREPGFPAEIVTVISNKADAGGIAVAREAGIPTGVVSHRDYPSREAFDAELDAALRRAGVELICSAGFMRILSDGFVDAWRDRQLNIHPSLLPAFKGLHVHERVLETGCRITGCTVHFVRPAMDEGPIVAQAAVPVLPGDTPEILADRVLAAEHKLYPLALRLVASGRTRIVDERVVIKGESGEAQPPLFMPAV
jgi:phosphoribosylglycinamide formyltransferase-1